MVSLTATDNAGGSGVSQITYSASGAQTISPTTVNGASANIVITSEGETTITYFASDNVGNVEVAHTLMVKIDKTEPSITPSATISGNPYTAGTWTNQNVTVTFNCTDALSGVGSVTQPITKSGEGGNQSASGTCTDFAGNSSSSSFTGVNIDKTPPTISVNSPTAGATYLLNQSVSSNYGCTDLLSGVASCIGTTAKWRRDRHIKYR